MKKINVHSAKRDTSDILIGQVIPVTASNNKPKMTNLLRTAKHSMRRFPML